jgi:hypothetical protein
VDAPTVVKLCVCIVVYVVVERVLEDKLSPFAFVARRTIEYAVVAVKPAIVAGDKLSAGEKETNGPPFTEYL